MMTVLNECSFYDQDEEGSYRKANANINNMFWSMVTSGSYHNIKDNLIGEGQMYTRWFHGYQDFDTQTHILYTSIDHPQDEYTIAQRTVQRKRMYLTNTYRILENDLEFQATRKTKYYVICQDQTY